MVGSSRRIESPVYASLMKEWWYLGLVPTSNGLTKFMLSSYEIHTIVWSHRFDLATASNESPQSIHKGVCIQGHCHLDVYGASDQICEENTIAFHKAAALLHMKGPEKIHACICEWRKVGGHSVTWQISHHLGQRISEAPSTDDTLAKHTTCQSIGLDHLV